MIWAGTAIRTNVNGGASLIPHFLLSISGCQTSSMVWQHEFESRKCKNIIFKISTRVLLRQNPRTICCCIVFTNYSLEWGHNDWKMTAIKEAVWFSKRILFPWSVWRMKYIPENHTGTFRNFGTKPYSINTYVFELLLELLNVFQELTKYSCGVECYRSL